MLILMLWVWWPLTCMILIRAKDRLVDVDLQVAGKLYVSGHRRSILTGPTCMIYTGRITWSFAFYIAIVAN